MRPPRDRAQAARSRFWLLYAKSEAENIPAHVLRRIKEEIEHG
jgi:hypothetical protein